MASLYLSPTLLCGAHVSAPYLVHLFFSHLTQPACLHHELIYSALQSLLVLQRRIHCCLTQLLFCFFLAKPVA